jgi:hypothetical protein
MKMRKNMLFPMTIDHLSLGAARFQRAGTHQSPRFHWDIRHSGLIRGFGFRHSGLGIDSFIRISVIRI